MAVGQAAPPCFRSAAHPVRSRRVVDRCRRRPLRRPDSSRSNSSIWPLPTRAAARELTIEPVVEEQLGDFGADDERPQAQDLGVVRLDCSFGCIGP